MIISVGNSGLNATINVLWTCALALAAAVVGSVECYTKLMIKCHTFCTHFNHFVNHIDSNFNNSIDSISMGDAIAIRYDSMNVQIENFYLECKAIATHIFHVEHLHFKRNILHRNSITLLETNMAFLWIPLLKYWILK